MSETAQREEKRNMERYSSQSITKEERNHESVMHQEAGKETIVKSPGVHLR